MKSTDDFKIIPIHAIRPLGGASDIAAIITLTKGSDGYNYTATRYVSYALDGVESYTKITDLTSDITLSGHTLIKFYAIDDTYDGAYVGTTLDGADVVIAISGEAYSEWLTISEDKTYYCAIAT